MDNDIKELMKNPKRHTLRHYMRLVCELYGEPKETREEYIDQQVKQLDGNLDGAIQCFKDLLPAEDPYKAEREAKAKRVKNFYNPFKRNPKVKRSSLCPMGTLQAGKGEKS